MADDWRLNEALKTLRQLQTCPSCGALVSAADGLTIHSQWHDSLMGLVNQIDTNFDSIFDYVTNPNTGLEKRLGDLINGASTAINTLRADATTAITNTDASVSQLRTDATNAINGVGTRVTNIENEITRTPGGIWNRLSTLETKVGIVATITKSARKGTLEEELT
jgi:hypothetical protein